VCLRIGLQGRHQGHFGRSGGLRVDLDLAARGPFPGIATLVAPIRPFQGLLWRYAEFRDVVVGQAQPLLSDVVGFGLRLFPLPFLFPRVMFLEFVE
jgi:hypothetical protein